MISEKPLGAAAERRLRHRHFRTPDGSLCLLSSDGRSAAIVTPRQWDAIVEDFTETMRPVNQQLRVGLNLTLPIFILTVVFMPAPSTIPLLGALRGQAGLIVAALFVMWWPLLMIARHAWVVRRLNRRIDTQLAGLPSTPVPTGRPIIFQTIEIAALILVGPGLAISVIGSLLPHIFDGTPLMGSSVGLFEAIGLLLLAALVGRRVWPTAPARRKKRAETAEWAAAEPDMPAAKRRCDPLARARNAES